MLTVRNYDAGHHLRVHSSLLSVVLNDEGGTAAPGAAKSTANGKKVLEPPADPAEPPRERACPEAVPSAPTSIPAVVLPSLPLWEKLVTFVIFACRFLLASPQLVSAVFLILAGPADASARLLHCSQFISRVSSASYRFRWGRLRGLSCSHVGAAVPSIRSGSFAECGAGLRKWTDTECRGSASGIFQSLQGN